MSPGQYLERKPDRKGQTTRLLRTARGLPSSRQDAKGQRIRYEYDQAIRLTALVKENNAAYQFAYDACDLLIEEKRIDNLTRQFSYNLGGHLTRVNEIGYGERAERPQRQTEFERDSIGRLLAKLNATRARTTPTTTPTACSPSSACRPPTARSSASAKKH
jgi:YD repeat-containing protein